MRLEVHFLLSTILGEKNEGIKTRSSFRDGASFTFMSQVELKNIKETLVDEDWILAMEEELNQFIRNNIWMWLLCIKIKV